MGWKMIPTTPQQDTARDWIADLYGTNVTYPTRSIAPMSSAESSAQKLLSEFMGAGTPAGVTQGIDYLSGVVGGQFDPKTSDSYQGYRAASKMEEEQAVNQLKRSAQLQGMNASTPVLNQEGQTRRGYSADRMGMLGMLYDNYANRQQTAAGQLVQYSDNESMRPYKQAAAGMALGGLPRELEQAEEDAIYESLVQTLLFPYLYQQGAANTILQEPRYYYKPSSGGGGMSSSDWVKIGTTAAMML